MGADGMIGWAPGAVPGGVLSFSGSCPLRAGRDLGGAWRGRWLDSPEDRAAVARPSAGGAWRRAAVATAELMAARRGAGLGGWHAQGGLDPGQDRGEQDGRRRERRLSRGRQLDPVGTGVSTIDTASGWVHRRAAAVPTDGPSTETPVPVSITADDGAGPKSPATSASSVRLGLRATLGRLGTPVSLRSAGQAAAAS